MKDNKIDSKNDWKKFLEWIDQHSVNSYYRGHSSKDYLLLPKVGRSNYSLSQELNMFEHFKRRAGLYSNFSSDFEWLALAQHHGLPTRLLDWTLNPLVAAFFAVLTNKSSTGRIYCLSTFDYHFVDISKYKTPFHINRIEFIHPPISTKRIELQKGIFSVHPLPNQPTFIIPGHSGDIRTDTINEIATYDGTRLDMDKPEMGNIDNINNFTSQFYLDVKPYFDIPPESKSYFENRIRHLGIDETIFGDVDSIARNIDFLNENKSLKPIIDPDYEMAKPFWEIMAGEQMSKYLMDNTNILSDNFGYKVYYDEFDFFIKEMHDKHYNTKSVTGNLGCIGYPNFENANEITFIKSQFKKYSILWRFLEDLNVKPNNLLMAFHDSLEVKIEFFTEGFKDIFKIGKVEVVNPKDNKLDITLQKAEKQFSQLKQQISPEDFKALLSCQHNGPIYLLLAAKYANKLIFTE